MNDRIAQLEAKLAVQETIFRYCLAFDTHDIDGLKALFADDMVMNSSQEFRGREATMGFLEDSLAKIRTSRHHVSNTTVTLDGESKATATSYFFVCNVRMDGEARIAFGTYRDRLARNGDEWLFVEKHHEVHGYGPLPDGFELTAEGGYWRP